MNPYIATLMAFTGLAAAEAQFKVCRDANFGGCGLMFANLGRCTTIGSPIANMISSVDSLGHDCTIYYNEACKGFSFRFHGPAATIPAELNDHVHAYQCN